MAEWDERAERWTRKQAERDQILGPATEMMLDLAGLRMGIRVLDVAAGTGDQTLLAARRVGPSGYVLATDISASMLNSAADAVQRAGLANVETRVMDAENLDLDADSFDAIICRLGLMNFPKALRGMRRVLKPGGKVAAIVMSTAEKNPYQGILLPIVQRSGSTAGRIFSLGEPGALEKAYKDGGFPDVDVHTVSMPRRFSSSTEVIESLKDEIIGQRIENLPNMEREQAWSEVER